MKLVSGAALTIRAHVDLRYLRIAVPSLLCANSAMTREDIEMKISGKSQKPTGPTELTKTETDQVAGGDGNHYGQLAKEQGVPAWSINSGKAADAPGHNK
jgi:hypothetical protein